MDLNALAQTVFAIAASVSLPLALALGQYALSQAQARWKFTVSEKLKDAVAADIQTVVDIGVGWGRAKLASGEMPLSHVTTGNATIDQIASAGLAMLSQQAKASGISSDDIARRIVAGLGHALGDDPGVPTIAPVPPVPAPAAVEASPASATSAPVAA